jgi:hypothetical protein
MLKPVSTTFNFHSLAPFFSVLPRSPDFYFQTQPTQLFSVTGLLSEFWFFVGCLLCFGLG